MSIERLIDQTRERFPHYNESQVEILPLEKGGSDRRYYRVRFSADHSLILVKYNPEKPENERFVAIANFLSGIGVNAPLIYYHDQEQALLHGSELVLGNELHLQPGFDESLYLWEQNYCLENCLGLYFQVSPAEIKRLREHAAFANLAKRLASYRRVLVHRD